MKILKTVLASFVLLILTTAFAHKANAQQVFRFDQTVTVATFATNINTVVNGNNWTETSVSCSGTTYICRLEVAKILGSEPTPTKSEIFTALAAHFNAQNPITFPGCGQSFTVSVTTSFGTYNYSFTFYCKN